MENQSIKEIKNVTAFSKIFNLNNNKKITDKNNKDIQIIIKKDEDNALYYEMDADV